MNKTLLILLLGALIVPASARAESVDGIAMPTSIDAFFGKYCYDCHDAATKKADLNLEGLTRTIANDTDAQHWQDILDQLNAGEMPPRKKEQPSRKELSAAIGDLTRALDDAQAMLKDSGGAMSVLRIWRSSTRTLMNCHSRMSTERSSQ